MEAVLDSVGRLVVPKPLREALGLTAGTKVDVSLYGSGLHVQPIGRSARLVRTGDGRLVADSDTTLTDEDVFGLLDSMRR
jgi:AbrB family looped-hinge helix DNA binding protein